MPDDAIFTIGITIDLGCTIVSNALEVYLWIKNPLA